jgi:hypothetical protein
MSLQIISTTETQYNPVFLKILEDIPGGVTIRTNRTPSTTKSFAPGTPLNADTTSVGLYNIVKTALLKRAITTSACVTIYVYGSDLPNSPGQEFIVGEYVMIDSRGSAATIASISRGTRTNGIGTDTIIFTAGGGGLNATAAVLTKLIEASAAAVTAADAKYDADCLLRDAVEVRLSSGYTLQNIMAGAVVRGTVDESILPYTSPNEGVKTPLTSRIRFA